MKRLLLPLLLAATAAAQPVVGPEVMSSPITGLGNFALAPQRDGFLVAWEQSGRIYAGHIDPALRLEGGAIELPPAKEGRTASSPSLATNGTTALLTWHEHENGQPDVNVVATILANAVSLFQAPRELNGAVSPPLAAFDGAAYVVYSDGYQFRVTDTLDASLVRGWVDGKSISLSNNGSVATAAHDWGDQLPCVHWFHGYGDCQYTVTYSLVTESGKTLVPLPVTISEGKIVTLLPAVVAANGDSFGALVRLPAETDVLLFDDAVQTRAKLPVTILTDAAIGGNGDDALIVWTGSKLMGIFVHADSSVSEPFVISGGFIDLPHVIAAGSNTFVVFYRTYLGAQQSALAGRVIHVQPSKQRAIR